MVFWSVPKCPALVQGTFAIIEAHLSNFHSDKEIDASRVCKNDECDYIAPSLASLDYHYKQEYKMIKRKVAKCGARPYGLMEFKHHRPNPDGTLYTDGEDEDSMANEEKWPITRCLPHIEVNNVKENENVSEVIQTDLDVKVKKVKKVKAEIDIKNFNQDIYVRDVKLERPIWKVDILPISDEDMDQFQLTIDTSTGMSNALSPLCFPEVDWFCVEGSLVSKDANSQYFISFIENADSDFRQYYSRIDENETMDETAGHPDHSDKAEGSAYEKITTSRKRDRAQSATADDEIILRPASKKARTTCECGNQVLVERFESSTAISDRYFHSYDSIRKALHLYSSYPTHAQIAENEIRYHRRWRFHIQSIPQSCLQTENHSHCGQNSFRYESIFQRSTERNFISDYIESPTTISRGYYQI